MTCLSRKKRQRGKSSDDLRSEDKEVLVDEVISVGEEELKVAVTIALPISVVERLTKEAQRLGVPRSVLARFLILYALEKGALNEVEKLAAGGQR